MTKSGEFDWSQQESIVVKRVEAIAVYNNEDGDIVIRQERAMLQIDFVVTIPAQHAHSIIEAIQRELKGPIATPRLPPLT